MRDLRLLLVIATILTHRCLKVPGLSGPWTVSLQSITLLSPLQLQLQLHLHWAQVQSDAEQHHRAK